MGKTLILIDHLVPNKPFYPQSGPVQRFHCPLAYSILPMARPTATMLYRCQR